MNRRSQCNRILALLESKEWVPLTEILSLFIANYRARISELREELRPKGGDILQEDIRVGRQRHSRYKLVRPAEQQELGFVAASSAASGHSERVG